MTSSLGLQRRVERWRLKSRRLSWQVLQRFRDQTTVSTRQGRLTVFTSDQVIGRSLYVNGEFEADVVSRTLSFLRAEGLLPAPGCGTVVDVGANMGVISIGMLSDGQFARAVALEPDPRNFALLRHNVEQNGFGADRCVCLQQGASDRKDELQFELSADNYGDHRIRAAATRDAAATTDPERFDETHRAVTTVLVDTLDHLLARTPREFADDVALAWIDTQGHEGFVFEGARQTFARGMPVVTELWPYGIRRSGMSQQQFCDIAASLWSHYWVWRRDRQFVRYPISSLDSLFAELSDEGDFDNIVFTQ